MVIWKRELSLTTTQDVDLPEGAEIILAREQHDRVCIWYRCNPEAPKKARRIAIVGTGDACPETEGRYLGTASLRRGNFMVFERV